MAIIMITKNQMQSKSLDNYVLELIIIAKNIKFHYMPEKKSQKRKKSLRNVNSLNIHWRNLDLISDFVNNAGKIKNRYQNRLPGD